MYKLISDKFTLYFFNFNFFPLLLTFNIILALGAWHCWPSILHYSRKRKKVRNSVREKHWLVALHMHPYRDQTYSLGMCLTRNQTDLLQVWFDTAQPNQALKYQPGIKIFILFLRSTFKLYHAWTTINKNVKKIKRKLSKHATMDNH